MDNTFGKIVDIIFAVILLFIFPLLYFSERTDTLMQQVVLTKATDFIDTIRTQGYITKKMYDTFLGQLDATNNIYDINFEHKKLTLEPEYRFKTPEEIIGEQDIIWNGQNIYHYYPISTELPKIEDPISPIGLNTETNESVLAHTVNGPADPNHVHSEECYSGHKHGDGTCNYTPTQASYWGRHEENVEGNSHHYIYCRNCGTVLADAHEYAQYSTQWQNDTKNIVYTEAATGGEQLEIPAYYWDEDNGWKAYEGYDEWYYLVGMVDKIKHNQPYDITKTHIKGCYYCGTGEAEYTIHRHEEALAPYNNADYYRPNNCFSTKAMERTQGSYDVAGVILTDSYSSGNTYKLYINGVQMGSGTGFLVYTCPVDGQRLFKIGAHNGPVYQYGYSFLPSSVDYVTLSTSPRSSGGYYNDYSIYLRNSSKGIDDGFISGPNGSSVPHHVHFKCGKYNGQITYKCGLAEDTTPDCSSIIVSISPTHPIQKVYLREPLITTATATYLDGSTKVILCSADFQPNTLVTDKIVNLFYYGSVDGKQTGPFTCTITVTVIPKTKTCPNGHTYNLTGDGSDHGCPYCAGWLKNLEVIQPEGGEISIYRGTTLIDNGVVLLATYFNGRTEQIYNGYVDNLDKYYVGTQNVTISYKGKTTTLNVITKRNLKKCDVCGKYYELYPDDTDPGCPFCKALIPVFTGNVLKYFSKTYSEEIVKELYEGSGIYYFNVGDYLSIDITSSNETIGTKLLGAVLKQRKVTGIHAQYGGSIRDETKVSDE